MMSTMPMLRFLGLCLLSATALAAADGAKDIIHHAEGRPWHVIVVHEGPKEVVYKTNPQLPEQALRWSDVRRIEYAGMKEGYYKAGMDEFAAGQYAQAAVRFESMVANANREWETAYGLLRQGESWERAGERGRAAAAYAAFVEALPEHRWTNDMRYRAGINFALAGEQAQAQAMAEALEAVYEQTRDRSVQTRASAVKTSIAATSGDIEEAKRQSNRVALSPRDGQTYYHWSEFWAGLLMGREQYGEAARVYERVLEDAADPGLLASLNLGLGLALGKDGRGDEALLTFLRLDALPYGSPAQRLEARLWIGKLLWQTASERLDHERESVATFAKEQQQQALRWLEAVAEDNLVDGADAIRAEAQSLLDRYAPAAEEPAADAEVDEEA